jgi:hypothetical protein
MNPYRINNLSEWDKDMAGVDCSCGHFVEHRGIQEVISAVEQSDVEIRPAKLREMKNGIKTGKPAPQNTNSDLPVPGDPPIPMSSIYFPTTAAECNRKTLENIGQERSGEMISINSRKRREKSCKKTKSHINALFSWSCRISHSIRA